MNESGDQERDGEGSDVATTWIYEFERGKRRQRVHTDRKLTAVEFRNTIGADVDLDTVKYHRIVQKYALGEIQTIFEEPMTPESLVSAKAAAQAADTAAGVVAELARRSARQALADMMPKLGADPLAPPKNGQFLLSLFTSRDGQEEIIGDMDERFATQVLRYGPERARAWYYWQTLQITGAFAVKKLLKVLGVARMMGLLKS